MAAAIGYYRDTFGGANVAPEHAVYAAALGQPTPKPTLYLHGSADNALGIELVKDVEQFLAPGSEVAVSDGLNHFLQLERPEEVNRRIVEFVTK
jgi:pimeloyl-ACP methyl ester carboxylesterase